VTAQESLADFVCDTSTADIDPDIWARAATGIADTVGVAFAGAREPLADVLYDWLRGTGELPIPDGAILIGRPERASARNAALYNATIAHALDYDDYDFAASTHLSAPLVAALLSVSPDAALFDDAFRTAYIVGYEVGGKVGRVLSRARRGPAWHSTGFVGPVACAAAAAKMLGLDKHATVRALGISMSCGSGVRANFGTMSKPLHAGRAAEAGVVAAELASHGFEASPHALDGERGFYRAFGVGDLEALLVESRESLRELGTRWEMQTASGFYLKPYPSCAGSHFAIEAALRIAEKVDHESIAHIEIGQGLATQAVLTYHRPQRELEAKFSMEYCVAAALRWRSVTIEAFSEARIRDLALWRLIDNTVVRLDDRVKDSGEHAAAVRVVLTNGEKLEELAGVDTTRASRWMSGVQQWAKFSDCVGMAMPDHDARSLFDAITGGEDRDRTQPALIARYLSGGAARV
jgi:2-methylcitrate dehydratase PrpD